MKKIYILSALALTFVFGSCTMEKRHHRNGYYISWNHQAPKATEKTSTAVAEPTLIAENAVMEETNRTLPTVVTPVVPETVTPTTTVAPVQSVTPSTKLTEKSANTVAPAKSSIKQAPRSPRNAETQSAPEVDKVVLVILCFFIPLLAVYLHEGSWTKRCTINLILCLLFYLPGIIHALWVVLAT